MMRQNIEHAFAILLAAARGNRDAEHDLRALVVHAVVVLIPAALSAEPGWSNP